MSNIADSVGHAFEQTKEMIEQHPWQAAAALAAWSVSPVVGVTVGAAELAINHASKAPAHDAPHKQMSAAAAAALLGGVGGAVFGHPAEGAALAVALEVVAVGAADGLHSRHGKGKPGISEAMEKAGIVALEAGLMIPFGPGTAAGRAAAAGVEAAAKAGSGLARPGVHSHVQTPVKW